MVTNLYWYLIGLKCKELDCDGCTAVSEWKGKCCQQHDVHYRTGYRWKLKVAWGPGGSLQADLVKNGCITRKNADRTFYECMKHDSGRLAGVRARARYWGVRILPFAWLAWRRYRKADGIQCPGSKQS